jgi:hypothetical protein
MWSMCKRNPPMNPTRIHPEFSGVDERLVLRLHVNLAHAVAVRSRAAIRQATRLPVYWRAADRFTDLLFDGALRINRDWALAAGADLAVIDTLYEEMASDEADERSQFTTELQSATDPSTALRILQDAGMREDDIRGFAKSTVASITVAGHETLRAEAGDELARRWLRTWQRVHHEHNVLQERTSALATALRLPADLRRAELDRLKNGGLSLSPIAPAFEAGVRTYLSEFAETAQSSLSIVGAMPFLPVPPAVASDYLTVLVDTPLLPTIARLLRYAQDLRYDPSELLNCGALGWLAERGLNLSDLPGCRATTEIEEHLLRGWPAFLADRERELERVLATLHTNAAKLLAGNLVDNVYGLVCAMTQAAGRPSEVLA